MSPKQCWTALTREKIPLCSLGPFVYMASEVKILREISSAVEFIHQNEYVLKDRNAQMHTGDPSWE